MTTEQPTDDTLRAEVYELAALCLSCELTAEQQTRLHELGCTSTDARRHYVRFISETLDLATWAAKAEPVAVPLEQRDRPPLPMPRRVRRPMPPPRAPMPARTFSRFSAEAARRPIAVTLLLGSVAACILAYLFWPSSAAVATIVDAQEAIWAEAHSPNGEKLRPGQRLVLKSGSAQIAFNSQARVILEGPTEFVVVDANACRLAAGKLTAHVPSAAQGFQVHTPSGTVTDLGTEFGVLVRKRSAVSDQPSAAGKKANSRKRTASSTEVHVFQGKVDIVPKGKPAQASTHPKSKILSAGEAVTISANKLQPLPAADPFKFALDKLQGKPRTVLLSEDFEKYDLVGSKTEAIGPWIVQSGRRKGQGVSIVDAPDLLSQYKTDAGDPYPNLTPPPRTGGRFVFIACAWHNRPETFPILAHEIDGKLLARNGQVLIEFDILQNSTGLFEPSLALAAQVEHTVGIELGRDAEGKKIEWLPYQCYHLRLLLSVVDGTVRGVRAERLHWRGSQGWVRDLTFEPAAKFDWSTPPRYAIFGFPVVSGTTPGNIYWLDNVRIEAITAN